MPIFKAGPKLVFYAHVPKCGGSSVFRYLRERFGKIAFYDSRYFSHPKEARWSRTSPQHIDLHSLSRLFPSSFFDASFTIIRHPVSRLVSAYHYQMEHESQIPSGTGFSEWLTDLPDLLAEAPFSYDNHVRPMVDLVPQDAKIFYLEHGLEALVPWFDALTGSAEGPRALPRVNSRGSYGRRAAPRPARASVTPTEWDIARIAELYADDFERFGYRIDSRSPVAPAPEVPPEIRAAQAAGTRRRPMAALSRRLRRRIGI